jgi:hypothetical protein
MGNNLSLGYDEDDQEQNKEQNKEQNQQQNQEQEQQDSNENNSFNKEKEEYKEYKEEYKEDENLKKNDDKKKSNLKKNKECANTTALESIQDGSKKRKQTVRNFKSSKKAGKTKSNKRILREYQSRYLNGGKEREREHHDVAGSTLLNSD